MTSAVRLAFGAALGLGVDESYMVASGRVLGLSYYDHPPISWWLSWGAAHLFGSEAAILVRLPFIALFALATWLMYRLGTAIANARAGLWAAILLNLSPVFAVTTGTWVLPDGPLDCALLGMALCLVHALERGTTTWWLAAGVCAGLALLSKYSAGLTMIGAGVYLLSSPAHRRFLATPKPWLSLVVALLMFSPVLAWNATHGWASFAFQGGRATGWHFRPLAPLTTLAGEALFVLPWLWLPMMLVFGAALRRGPGDWRPWLCCCLAAPPILIFALISAWSSQHVLFHWAAPGYLMLFPLLGDAVARREAQPLVRYTLAATAIFVLLGMTVVATQVRFDWLNPVIVAIARKDPDIDAVNWTSLRSDPRLAGNPIIGVPNWRDAGKIAYALGPGTTVVCLNRDGRQFGITWPPATFIGKDMLILAPEHHERVLPALSAAFDDIEQLADTPIRHAGRTLENVAVFEATHLRAWPPPGS